MKKEFMNMDLTKVENPNVKKISLLLSFRCETDEQIGLLRYMLKMQAGLFIESITKLDDKIKGEFELK